MRLCKMFSGSKCTQEVECLKKEIFRLERESSSYKCSLDSQLGTIQEQKAIFDFKMAQVDREQEALITQYEEDKKNLLIEMDNIKKQLDQKIIPSLSCDKLGHINTIMRLEEDLDDAHNKIEQLNSKLVVKIKSKKVVK